MLRRRLVAGLVLGFVVVLAVLVVGDMRQVAAHFVTFNWHLAPIVLGCTLFNYSLRFVKWHIYLRLIGAACIPWWESARLFVAGFPLAVTPGKVGEALKGLWVNQRTGVPVARAIPVVIAERITDGLAVLLLSVMGVIAYPQYWPAFALVVSGLLALVVLSQIRPLALALIGRAEALAPLRKAAGALRTFYEGTYLLFRPGPLAMAVGLGTVSWLGEGIGFYYVLRGLGLPPDEALLPLAIFILSSSTVVGAVSTLPGGLGAAEVSIGGMLAVLLELGADIAAAATLSIRFATLWFGVALGLAVWALSPDLLGLLPSSSASPEENT